MRRVLAQLGVDYCRRRRLLLMTLLPVLVLICACRQPPAISADMAVRIDGEGLHYGDFESFLRHDVDRTDSPLESEVLSQLFDQFLEAQLLIRLAIERGLVEPDVDQRQAVEFLLRDDSQPIRPMAEIEAYYEAHEDDYRHPEEVHLRQILVHERAEAEQAKKAIDDGESFAEVAARFSQEPRASLGGDQGRLARGDLPASYVAAIFDLDPGEVTDIIAADYGFHLFQVVERYPAELIPLEEVRVEIESTLLRLHRDELVQDLIAEARERYNVVVFPANFPFDYQGHYVQHSTTSIAE